jgi:hypothetical protein
MRKTDSRTHELDNEICVSQAGNNRYDLILIGASRLRELRRQARDSNHLPTCIDALKDIQAGSVDPIEYLNKVK